MSGKKRIPMKNYLLYFFLLMLTFGCQYVEKSPKPDDLIPEEKMVDILEDMAKIDAAMSYNMRAFEEKGIDPQKYVYKKYNVDSAQLAESNAYYIEKANINRRMYEEVRRRLNKASERMDSIQKREDSLRVIRQKKDEAPLDSLEQKENT